MSIVRLSHSTALSYSSNGNRLVLRRLAEQAGNSGYAMETYNIAAARAEGALGK